MDEAVDVSTGVAALAESEDLEFADDDEDSNERQPSPLPVVDRYGFSGGQQFTDPNKEYLPPVEVLRAREMKWLEMCRNWDHWSTAGIKKLRERCRKGIPDSMRGEAWQRLVGSPTTKFQQTKAYVDEPVELPVVEMSPLRRLFGSTSRLSSSRSLPTVVTNSPSTGRSRILESSQKRKQQQQQQREQLLCQQPPGLPPLMPPPAAAGAPSSPSLYRDSLSRRKGTHTSSSSQFKSFRKFSSLFRLPNNNSSGAAATTNVSQPPAAENTEDTDASNFFQRGEMLVSHHQQHQGSTPCQENSPETGGGERSRTYSAALPSAAYLGISLTGGAGSGGNVEAVGNNTGGGGGHPQTSDSTTTTTSTGVSMDAYSTSSNFFSAPESSAESLRVAGTTDSYLNSPALMSRGLLFPSDHHPAKTGNSGRHHNSGGVGNMEISPNSSHFSTLSSTHRSSMDDVDADLDGIDVDRIGGGGDSTSSSSLLALRDPHNFTYGATAASNASAAAKDREATLVAPGGGSSGGCQPDPYVLYDAYKAQEGDPATCDQIGKDIHRQFPFHELFCSKNSGGRESLFSILKAYTVRHPNKGYCQGQAPIAAVLLMFMPEADAFWTFTEICERYLISYYDEGLELIQIDGQILYGLLKRLYPQIYKFLMKHGAEPIMLVVEWFMCVYTRTLPWASVLRVLDMFFCEGKVIIFKVGLLLLYRCFGSASFRKSCEGIDEILLQAQKVPAQLENPEELVHDILQIRIDRRQVAREVIKQSQRWRARMAGGNGKK